MSTANPSPRQPASTSPLAAVRAKTTVYPGMAGIGKLRKGAADGARGKRRILGGGHTAHCYHVMSRTCGGEVVFDDLEKEALVELLLIS